DRISEYRKSLSRLPARRPASAGRNPSAAQPFLIRMNAPEHPCPSPKTDHETASHRPFAPPQPGPDLQEMPQALGRRGQDPWQAEARTQATSRGEEDIAAGFGKLLRNLPQAGGRAGERAQPGGR